MIIRWLAAGVLFFGLISVCKTASLTIISAISVNDKLQKEYQPYLIAVAAEFGKEFVDAHLPYRERRRICQWNGRDVECGYLMLSSMKKISEQEMKILLKILLDPCRYVNRDGVEIVTNISTETRKLESREKLTLIENRLNSLRDICRFYSFRSDLIRVLSSRNNEYSDIVEIELRIAR